MRRTPPLKKALDFISCVGHEQSLIGMFHRILEEMPRLIGFDHGFIIFGDPMASSGIEFSLSMGISDTVKRLYLDHYCKYDIIANRIRHSLPVIEPCFTMDWNDRSLPESEFVTDFVRKLAHINVCMGIPFTDLAALHSTGVFELARSGSTRFSVQEERLFRILQPHITNFYSALKRLEQYPQYTLTAAELKDACRILSMREAEVCSLLLRRLRHDEIASRLMISRRTVEHHVENVFNKLGVHSRKDLFTRLLMRK